MELHERYPFVYLAPFAQNFICESRPYHWGYCASFIPIACTIVLREYTTISLSISLSVSIWIMSSVLGIVLLCAFQSLSFGGHVCISVQCILKVKFLGHWVFLCSAFVDTAKQCLKWFHKFILSPLWEFRVLYILVSSWYCLFFCFSHFGAGIMVSRCG